MLTATESAWATCAAERALARRAGDRARLRALAPRLRAIADEHAALWRLRCRDGGLVDSLTPYHRAADDLDAS